MFKCIDIEEANTLINDGTTTIFDVRNKEAYDESHIENALHLTRSNFVNLCQTLDKTSPILVYCYHGRSSQVMAKFIAEQGFTEIYSLNGGYAAWIKAQTQ